MTSPTTARVEPKLEDVDLDYTTTIVPETTTFTNQNTSSTSHRPQVQPSRGYEPSVESVSASEDHPLAGYSMGQLAVMGELYAYDHGMEAHSVDFQKGAILAANPEAFKHTSLFTEEDKEVLEREKTHKWSHPVALYHMVIMCSMAAVVQGMGRDPYFSIYGNLSEEPILIHIIDRRNGHQWRPTLLS